MNQQHESSALNATDAIQQPSHRPDAGRPSNTFPLTDLPTWLALLLVALGVPRTVLADLDIVAPEREIRWASHRREWLFQSAIHGCLPPRLWTLR